MRLIDADALKEVNFTIPSHRGCGKNPLTVLIGSFWAAIDAQPTIDAEPAVHAHWERKGFYCICSHCRCHSSCTSLFCQYCGAKMDEEVK